MNTKKQWKTCDEVVVKGVYRYKGRDEPLVFEQLRNHKNPRYSSEDFTPVGYTGVHLHRNEVVLIVEGPIAYKTYRTSYKTYRTHASGAQQDQEWLNGNSAVMHAVKILSADALGWISAGELETVFEEVTEDDQETDNQEQETRS